MTFKISCILTGDYIDFYSIHNYISFGSNRRPQVHLLFQRNLFKKPLKFIVLHYGVQVTEKLKIVD